MEKGRGPNESADRGRDKEQAADDAGEPALGVAEDGLERLQHAGQRQRTVMLGAVAFFARHDDPGRERQREAQDHEADPDLLPANTEAAGRINRQVHGFGPERRPGHAEGLREAKENRQHACRKIAGRDIGRADESEDRTDSLQDEADHAGGEAALSKYKAADADRRDSKGNGRRAP